MNKSDQIRSILAARYPCEAVPPGAMTDIANEIGASRELVRQVVSKSGYETPGSGPRAAAPRSLCTECGKPLRLNALRLHHTRCAPKVEVACATCGNAKVIPLKDVRARFIGSGKRRRERLGTEDTGLWFCNHVCAGSYQGKTYGWGNPDHPRNKAAEEVAE